MWKGLKQEVLLVCVLWALTCLGCAHDLHLYARSGNCLNPPEMYCTSDGSNSRLLEVRAYQLKDHVDASALNWGDLVTEGQDIAVLRPYLTDPEKATMVRTMFSIQRLQSLEIRITKLKDTKYILFVAAGRHPGEHSIALTPLEMSQSEILIYLERFDIELPVQVSSPQGH